VPARAVTDGRREAPVAEADWQHFPHGADIGVRGRGASLADAFANAALAMTAVITDPDTVRPKTAVEIRCDAPDPELLLVDWLNALIFEMATRGMLFSRFEVAIEDGSLSARAMGEALDAARHAPAVEIKGATMTALSVQKDEEGVYTAQCVVDV
jgi:tRNA nucleotidyltransferase (CCA-adding enzyme)